MSKHLNKDLLAPLLEANNMIACVCCGEDISQSSFTIIRCDACISHGCWPFPAEDPVTMTCQRPEYRGKHMIALIERRRALHSSCALVSGGEVIINTNKGM